LIEDGGDLEQYLKSIGFNILNKKDNHYFIQTNRGLEEISIDDNLTNHYLFVKAKQEYEKIEQYKSLVDGDLLNLLEIVEKKARTGANIQRYKGLGEMNPEQLWETTMNPENRVLIQVKIEDIEIASDYFELFMGNEVEPRRDYIQTHAKDVENLDV
jgi:DNA gyrase subunit B